MCVFVCNYLSSPWLLVLLLLPLLFFVCCDIFLFNTLQRDICVQTLLMSHTVQ